MIRAIAIILTGIFTTLALSAQSTLYSVEELYEMTLENSAALMEKEARERAAGFRVKEARSKSAPVLSFESSMSYISNPDTLTVETGAFGTLPPGLGSIPMPSESSIFELTGNTYYDFKLIVDQPVFTWGKLYHSLQASKEGAAAATLDTLKMRDQLKSEIQINVTTIQHLKEIRLAIQKQKEIAARLEFISKDSYENGMILMTDYLDALGKRKEADLAENRIEEQINQQILNLIYLTGRDITPEQIPQKDNEILPINHWEEIYMNALKNNRDLSMYRHQIAAEEYKNKIQKGIYYFKPDLAFHMELSYSGSYFPIIQDDWLDKDKGNLTLSIGIKAPLADFGGMYSAARASEEELRAVLASYEYSLQQIEKVIRQIVYSIELTMDNIDYYEVRMETDRQMMEQKEKEWETGYGDETDFLQQQISFYSNMILINQEMISLKTMLINLQNIQGTVNN